MAHISHKLSSSIDGALAGGGDPASSPLYVFGPFLSLIVVAGVSGVTFGASIWLAVLTVVTVSAMYRLVMIWVTDGSGGSGLSEEEFGPWAVKVNAGVTVVEYTLTFLVSIAALVTFVADRLPILGAHIGGVPLRTVVAIALSVLTGFVVNRGPKMAARAFGPATAAVLLLLWVMIVATIWKQGFHLPSLRFAAFTPDYIGVTLGGYARILALMTGVEIFANLVAAYEGPASKRSRKAFGSLIIVMSTTSLTMLIVGPAIYELADPLDPSVSVFTQTMDQLLPVPLAYLGTLIGIAVLLSAAAASAQGLQNLALGLRYRHYIPASFGQRNRFDVADKPVWLQVGVCALCFALFGTDEETYLALYAAGVFILLSLTGWAAVKRLNRERRATPTARGISILFGTMVAAILTTSATVVIFEERFREGAWAYFLLVPALFAGFGWFRARLGRPSPVEDRLGLLISSSYLPPLTSQSLYTGTPFRNLLVPLDGSPAAEQALIVAQRLSRASGARITLLSIAQSGEGRDGAVSDRATVGEYLTEVGEQLQSSGHDIALEVREGEPSAIIGEVARSGGIDAVVMTTQGRTRWARWLTSSVTSEVIYLTTPPLIVVRPSERWSSTRTRFSRLLVALDGSEIAEQVVPYVYELAGRFRSHVILLSVLEGSDSDGYGEKVRHYLERFKEVFAIRGISAEVVVEESAPAQAILRAAETYKADAIMLVSHGRGGVARQQHVKLGSVVDRVLQETPCPVFLVSATPSGAGELVPEGSLAVERPGREAADDQHERLVQ